ncbi:MAG: histone deacetylase family protein [Magnetospirillum sp. WYHS-4]
MPTLLITHPICLLHEMGEHHPESPDRLRVILQALETQEFVYLVRMEAPLADRAALERVHDPAYVADILDNGPATGHRHLDADTGMSPASAEAALRAAGGACAAVDAVMTGEARNVFCAVRPPGHHAERARAMGFCLFNNVAVAAYHARAAHGIRRVAVVDFDVHHGNGTQDEFWEDGSLFYASSHQWPAYPGTGREHDHGVAGNIVNVPLAPGSGSEEFRRAYSEIILPALSNFKPELLIISAGFDAHARDPLAYLRVQTEDFGWVTRELLKVADACCKGRVVSCLEGGYDLQALSMSVAAHMRALMGH